MKTYVVSVFILLSAFCSQAQIVNIPDVNLKTKLLNNYPVIDVNDDGEIQYSEAEGITYLNLAFSNIADATGIEAFVDLVILDIRVNQLTSLDLSNNTALFELSCSDNQIVDLNLGINATLSILRCGNNQISSLELDDLPGLRVFDIDNNSLTAMDVSHNGLLEDLNVSNNNLETIILTGAEALKFVYLGNNNLTSLDVSNLNNLESLICALNSIVSINLNNTPLLNEINIADNQITNLDLSNKPVLVDLSVNNNFLTEVSFSDAPNIMDLKVNDNLLNSLDLSNLSQLTMFYLANNPNLNYINLKNGKNENLNVYTIEDDFINLPNLEVICVDDLMSDYSLELQDFLGPEVLLTAYCSFTPGGDFYVINGSSILDINNNGCNTSDPKYANLVINITDGEDNGTFYTNFEGNYAIPLQEGNYNITPQLENPSYFSITPESFAVNFPVSNSPLNQDFCITPNGTYNDLEVSIIPTENSRPGFDSPYLIIFKNKGTTILSGAIIFQFQDNFMEFVLANVPPETQNLGELIWSYNDLYPFETREIDLIMNLNTPIDPDFPLNEGDVLLFTATINPISGDESPDDNIFQLAQTVVNSFDPNDISCLQGDKIEIQDVGGYVNYVIRFENIGNAAAQNIVVKNDIDISKFDISTLISLTSSHDMEYRIVNNNQVEFIFEDINLPFDDATNDGYLSYKIKTQPSLQIGDTFSNQAEIFFDFNFPIITNIATTEVVEEILNIENYSSKYRLNIYPNPTSGKLSVISTKDVINEIIIYDVMGKKLMTADKLNSLSTELDISQLANGLYFAIINNSVTVRISKR